MFKVARVEKVWWPVTVEVPQDGGKTKKQYFDAELTIPEQKEHDDLVVAGGDVLEQYLTGNFKRARNEDGTEDLPNGEETKAALLRISYVRNGLLAAFYQAYHGRAPATQK